jgi:hypothetical protein
MLQHFEGLIVLDGHLLIETEGAVDLVQAEAFDPLPLSGIIQVYAPASAIFRRRLGTKASKSEAQITRLFRLETVQAKALALRQHVGHYLLRSDDPAELVRVIQELMKRRTVKACR